MSVTGAAARSSLVAFGDSITDGAVTKTGANHRWPDRLAERLRQDPALARIGVLNTGIGGNRLLRDPNPPAGNPAEAYAAYFGEAGLRRFDRDVLAQPGARYAIVLLGVNDLGHPGNTAPADEEVTAADLIAGYRKLVQRAHARGLKIFGATILPFEGDTLNFHTPEREGARQAVNRWIRTSGAYDGGSSTSTRPYATPGTPAGCSRRTTAETTSTPTTPAWPRWPARFRSASSADHGPRPTGRNVSLAVRTWRSSRAPDPGHRRPPASTRPAVPPPEDGPAAGRGGGRVTGRRRGCPA